MLFDLVSVIAVASAAVGLHHAILDFRMTEGALKFSASFFAIWWAWMNFTWYASAYDNNSCPRWFDSWQAGCSARTSVCSFRHVCGDSPVSRLNTRQKWDWSQNP
ncbi:hypothetical protein CPA45_02400 [Vreelandella nigrificans]|uniref:Uncharacterized protein n=1 Tax=Vreelandella nigrificans TaxID=2042704 RepID=A0A2A4HS32_9GAMM|nr:hypothetical protein CPA45_02400 [Halomonas nigrificans]